nr:hypothetical protein [Tanacetum cinerariifolium]
GYKCGCYEYKGQVRKNRGRVFFREREDDTDVPDGSSPVDERAIDENEASSGHFRDEPQKKVRRPTRPKVTPTKFNDFVVNSNMNYGLEKFINAMNQEIEALHKNNDWVLADLHVGRKSIGCKWIYKIKYKASSEIDRYKVRCLIGLAVFKNCTLFQLDVNNEFLYGDLHEEVYMSLPLDYYDKNETKVYKLVKSLYGLKQTPRLEGA